MSTEEETINAFLDLKAAPNRDELCHNFMTGKITRTEFAAEAQKTLDAIQAAREATLNKKHIATPRRKNKVYGQCAVCDKDITDRAKATCSLECRGILKSEKHHAIVPEPAYETDPVIQWRTEQLRRAWR